MLAILLLMAQMTAADSAPQVPPATPAPDPDEGRVVERIVAVLRSPGLPPRPITLITLTEEARVALAAQGVRDATVPLGVAGLRSALRWLVDQRLVSDEAVRLKLDEVPHEEVEASRRSFRELFGAPDAYQVFLASTGLSDRAVGVMLERDLRVRRFLASRAGRSGRVTEEELDRELRDKPGGGATPPAREEVRARLEEARLRAALQQQVADLRARVEVRVLDPTLREEAPR